MFQDEEAKQKQAEEKCTDIDNRPRAPVDTNRSGGPLLNSSLFQPKKKPLPATVRKGCRFRTSGKNKKDQYFYQ